MACRTGWGECSWTLFQKSSSWSVRQARPSSTAKSWSRWCTVLPPCPNREIRSPSGWDWRRNWDRWARRRKPSQRLSLIVQASMSAHLLPPLPLLQTATRTINLWTLTPSVSPYLDSIHFCQRSNSCTDTNRPPHFLPSYRYPPHCHWGDFTTTPMKNPPPLPQTDAPSAWSTCLMTEKRLLVGAAIAVAPEASSTVAFMTKERVSRQPQGGRRNNLQQII